MPRQRPLQGLNLKIVVSDSLDGERSMYFPHHTIVVADRGSHRLNMAEVKRVLRVMRKPSPPKSEY